MQNNQGMEHKDVIQRGNSLQVTFVITNQNISYATKMSPSFVISGAAVLEFRVVTCYISNNGYDKMFINLVFVRFYRSRPDDDDVTFKLNFTCKELAITDKIFTSDDCTWHLIHENRSQRYTFSVTANMDIVPNVNSFASLHEDEELTDFELRGEDGAIRVHKAVLAAASPVFRRMLCGAWKESTEGHFDVPGTSKTTLQQLKNFVYLRTLPETGLEQLILLASCYIIEDLEQKCVDKLVHSLSALKVTDLLEFAAKNNLTRLLLAILESVQNGEVKVKDIREHALGNNAEAND